MRNGPATSDANLSVRGILVLIAAIGLMFALVPDPVGADDAHTRVHIVDPNDEDLQATIFSEGEGSGRLKVESRTSEAQSGVVITELLTPADPVGVFIEADDAEELTRNLSSVFGVATPDTRKASYLRFIHIKTADTGPVCDSAPGTAFPQVTEFATLWVPPQGQAQIEFPMFAAHVSAGCAVDTCEETHCFVAHLLSGGPVNASITGPFD